MKLNLTAVFQLPDWVPDFVRLYIDHTGEGIPLRELARREGTHPSTVMRKVRRCEMRREDPLVDEVLSHWDDRTTGYSDKDKSTMNLPISKNGLKLDQVTLAQEGRRILRRLAEPGAILAIAPDMEKAVVLREFPDGRSARTGVLDRGVAQAFALNDWISCRKQGRVASYEITPSGLSALRQLLEESDQARQGMADDASPFDPARRDWAGDDARGQPPLRRVRYSVAESPVALLGRRRDKDGKAFLEPELVMAAERLREDFELAHIGARVAHNWEVFLTANDNAALTAEDNSGTLPRDARDRVAAALRDLGPGLGDVALRVCCYQEGIEGTEKRLGWAARSGKIVLRIALQRLRRHYEERYKGRPTMIG